MKLEQLKLFIDNLYDQLDNDQIDDWDVDGLEITDDNGVKYIISVDIDKREVRT